MRVLITDGNERSALAAARSLMRARHTVHVAAASRLSLAGVSRGAVPHVVAADPLADPAAYAAELILLAQRERIDLLLPLTDPSTEAVLEHRAALPRHIALPFPDLATYRRASDKAGMRTLAERCGFGVPETRVLASPAAGGVLPDVVAAAERAGFSVTDLSLTEPTLETVFINLTGKELRD